MPDLLAVFIFLGQERGSFKGLCYGPVAAQDLGIFEGGLVPLPPISRLVLTGATPRTLLGDMSPGQAQMGRRHCSPCPGAAAMLAALLPSRCWLLQL